MLVELKNEETYNGHLVNCDTWMNIHLREVICTSKYLRVPDEVQDEKSRADRKPPIVGRGKGRGREDGTGGRLANEGNGRGRGRGGPGGRTGGARGGGHGRY
uniref:U6 snRNA-associated Sm-like protein LSm4 n=1 Tax=Tanacetum cinerariifolium TaxID=118510 RepID=A0A699IBY1_TANCI|nr:probable U6 snRNA-associated Sm-like protein LSm4 [Tanacetum cinerariifolium]